MSETGYNSGVGSGGFGKKADQNGIGARRTGYRLQRTFGRGRKLKVLL